MPAEQSGTNKTPAIAIAKTLSSRQARADTVSSMEIDDYVCIAPSTPLSQAIEAMKQDEGGCVIVCEDHSRLVGIFTERDLLTKIVGENVDLNAPISNWMSPVVATLGPDATIGETVAMMNDKGHRNIPIVRNGKLVGSVSVFDVIGYLAESYPKTTMNLPPNPNQVMDSKDGG